MNIAQLMKGSAWGAIAAVASKLTFMVAVMTLAHGSGREVVGEFGLIQAAIVMFASVGAQAVSTSVAQHIGRHSGEAGAAGSGVCSVLACSVTLVLAIAGLVLCWPERAGEIFLGRSSSPAVIWLAVAIIGATVLMAWVQGILSGLRKFRRIALLNMVSAAVGLPAIVYLGATHSLIGALLGVLMSQVIALACGLHVLVREEEFRAIIRGAVPSLAGAEIVLLVGVPVLLTGLMVAPAGWISNKLLLGAGGMAAVGLYAAASQLNAILSHVSVVLGGVLIPVMANRAIRTSETEAFNMLCGWVAVALASLPVLLFPQLLLILFGHSYDSKEFFSASGLAVLSATVVAYKGGISRKIVAMNLAWYSVASNLLWAILFVCLAFLWSHHGAVGIAGALLAAHVAHFCCGTPVFLWKKVVRPLYLYSLPVILIWLAVAVAYIAGLASTSISLRLVALACCASVIVWSAFAVLKHARSEVLQNA